MKKTKAADLYAKYDDTRYNARELYDIMQERGIFEALDARFLNDYADLLRPEMQKKITAWLANHRAVPNDAKNPLSLERMYKLWMWKRETFGFAFEVVPFEDGIPRKIETGDFVAAVAMIYDDPRRNMLHLEDGFSLLTIRGEYRLVDSVW